MSHYKPLWKITWTQSSEQLFFVQKNNNDPEKNNNELMNDNKLET